MDNRKQIYESTILDIFRKHFPGFPKGRLIKSESPDFILKTRPKYAICIELTSLPHNTYEITTKNILSLIADIKVTIAKKEEKLNFYRKKQANEYWLIIHADSITINSINLKNHIDKLSVCSGFERIFLFGLFEGEVWEL